MEKKQFKTTDNRQTDRQTQTDTSTDNKGR